MNSYEVFSTLTIAILGSTLLNTIVSRLFDRADRKRDSTESIKESLRLILLDMLHRQGQSYIEQGSISKDQWETYDSAYHLYHDKDKLGGNGYAEKIYDEVRKLKLNND